MFGFLENLARGPPYFWFFRVCWWSFENFESFCERRILVYFEFCLIFVQSLCRGNIDFFQNSAFPCAELCRVLGNSWCCWIFENFQSILNLRKIWPGVCPILEILSFCLRLLKILEIRKYSKCRFLGKIGQGSALHWCFWFLKFSKCGFLRKFDQGSALFLKFWGFVRDFWKCLKFLKFLSVEF